MDFPAAIRSFVGYLEGTEKSAHTIKNYRLDLLAFDRFLRTSYGSRPRKLEELSSEDVEKFHEWLKGQELKTNTRRRKLMTVRKFLGYLSNRGKAPVEAARKVPTPHKVERVPVTVPSERLLELIRALPEGSELELRNKVLLWTLAETGCLVSELAQVRFTQWKGTKTGASLQFSGKSERSVAVSRELHDAVERLRERVAAKGGVAAGIPYLFLGFNKFGSLGAPITPRGIELLVRAYAPRFAMPELTPRVFRHSAVLRWFGEKASAEEIQRRLGLKSAYAFRAFEPILANLK